MYLALAAAGGLPVDGKLAANPVPGRKKDWPRTMHRSNVPRGLYPGYRLVGMRRNPYAHAISFIFSNTSRLEGRDFLSKLHWVVSRRQSCLRYYSSRRLAVDEWIRTEHLKKDLHALGVEVEVPRLMASKHADPTFYFRDNPAAVAMVKQWARTDFERFGYEMPKRKPPPIVIGMGVAACGSDPREAINQDLATLGLTLKE